MKSGAPACLIVLVLLVVLAGCRPAAGDDGGPPPSGWPQPAGDRVTQSMCGLLTNADYAKLGHARRPKITGSVTDRSNSLYCQYQGSDEMALSLQPSADFAKYEFAAELTEHKGQLAEGHRRSGLVNGVVGAADESWFDYWGPGTAEARAVAHEIRVRRGALILGITLNGVRGKHEKDPRSVLVDLADLVLRRLPHVGAKDTGTQHKIEYEAIGTGKATSIDWDDYTSVQNGGTLSNVRLPWLHMVPMASAGGARPASLYLRVEASSPRAKVGCLIVVDGVPVAGIKPQPRFVDCQADFPDTSGGGGAQPASFSPMGPFPSHPHNRAFAQEAGLARETARSRS
jgi:hypothetical protein